MKLLIISDVHSNVSALQAVERDAGKVDAVYCAGDHVDCGTDPHEAIQWIKDHGATAVIGNHDRYLLEVAASNEVGIYRGTKQWGWVHDNIDRMYPEDFDFLNDLPAHCLFSADGIEYIMQHQMLDNSFALPETVEQFDVYWNSRGGGASPEKRLIFGHIHRQCVHQFGDHKLWLNPGSVGCRRPDEKDRRAQYMLITDGAISFHAVEYDRSGMYGRALEYERKGTMADNEIKTAKMLFG